MHKLSSKQIGFTLMQMLVTVALVSIVTAFALPGLSNIVVGNRLTTYTNEFVSALNIARSEAIKRHAWVTVRRDASSTAGWNKGYSVFVDNNRNNTYESTDTLLKKYDPLPNTYTLYGNTNFVNFVTYRPDGTSNQFGAFAVCNNNNLVGAKLIIINILGRIRIGADGQSGNPKDGIPEKDGWAQQLTSCTNP